MKLEASGAEKVSIDDEALDALEHYEWPGNMRQLRNIMRTLIGLCDNNRITIDDLPEEIFSGSELGEPRQRVRPSNPLDIAERDAIIRELEAAHWNVTRVATKLNISRNTLYRKMKRYDVKPPR